MPIKPFKARNCRSLYFYVKMLYHAAYMISVTYIDCSLIYPVAFEFAPDYFNFLLFSFTNHVQVGEDKDLSVMTRVEVKKLFPGKKV